jgi:hypothetical protein
MTPLYGHKNGRFFHGYYGGYCYLALYVFCGRHLLAAKLRRSNIDASAGATDAVARMVGQIRMRWARVRILLRADSGFPRDELMTWCEANGVDYIFGLARNERLVGAIARVAAREYVARTYDRPCARYATSVRFPALSFLKIRRTNTLTVLSVMLRSWAMILLGFP